MNSNPIARIEKGEYIISARAYYKKKHTIVLDKGPWVMNKQTIIDRLK